MNSQFRIAAKMIMRPLPPAADITLIITPFTPFHAEIAAFDICCRFAAFAALSAIYADDAASQAARRMIRQPTPRRLRHY